jgi:polyisoprenoid-binding protein YceI
LSTALDHSGGPSSTGGVDFWDAILQKGALKQWELTIPVQNLKSGESGLDKNMYKSLKVKESPEITFKLMRYEVHRSTTIPSVTQISASGTLQVAGHERTIELQGLITPEPKGLHLEGEYPLLMTDFGIKPPTLMMGAIKVKDRVVIHFDLHLISDLP